MVPKRRRAASARSRWPLAAGLAAGVALDALLGDPRRGHPVAAFGRAAAALEARDYADSRGRGAAHVAACVLAVAAPAAILHRRTRGRPPCQAAAAALAVWAVTGARSLHHEAERIGLSLHHNDLASAREVLPSLCGRDPSQLDATEITRAVIESVAENTSDAVVAPLLWGAVAGIPGLVAYRAVNTLDAMVGYRSARYRQVRLGLGAPGRRGQLDSGPRHRRADRGLRPPGDRNQPRKGHANHTPRRWPPSEPERGPVRGGLRGRARDPPGRDERLRRRGRGAPGTRGGGPRPGVGGHPPRGRTIQGGHRVRDRPGRAGRASYRLACSAAAHEEADEPDD